MLLKTICFAAALCTALSAEIIIPSNKSLTGANDDRAIMYFMEFTSYQEGAGSISPNTAECAVTMFQC